MKACYSKIKIRKSNLLPGTASEWGVAMAYRMALAPEAVLQDNNAQSGTTQGGSVNVFFCGCLCTMIAKRSSASLFSEHSAAAHSQRDNRRPVGEKVGPWGRPRSKRLGDVASEMGLKFPFSLFCLLTLSLYLVLAHRIQGENRTGKIKYSLVVAVIKLYN